MTETMQQLGRTPDVQVVDGVERRIRRSPPEVPYAALLKAENPAGSITFSAVAAIEDALVAEKPARVLVDGEEDLLALPAVDSAPIGSVVYYGQPGEGVVVVPVDERAKASAEELMSRMVRKTR